MKPSFNISVVQVGPDPAQPDVVNAQVRVDASWFFIRAGVIVSLWFNPKTRRGGVKAQSAI